ncbi:ABC transporter substrate-binding protein [Clostridium hydrogeniformans]|uniref:ABC transporter substrate-binding protein n=1 Tax=Clostridium hydrogeniformans TaxID=349933 RepID=UPI000489878E|nr:ABC transporter substrate-binding protein [Clostridium hydrogeniformans]
MKRVLLTILSLTIVASMVGCGVKNNETDSNNSEVQVTQEKDKSEITTKYPTTIKNFNSESKEYEQTFDKVPEKVVSMHANTTKMIYELGLEDNLVAAALPDGKVSKEMEEKYKKLKTTFKGFPPEESVVGLEPDLLIGIHPSFMGGRATTEQWNEKGVKTYKITSTLEDRTVENHLKNILDIGKILGEEKRINEYVEKQKADISKVQEAVKNVENRPKVILLHKIKDEYAAFGSNTLGGNVAGKAGLNLVSGTPQGGFGLETLVGMNPDIIIYSSYPGTDENKTDEEKIADLTNETALQSINAIKNNKILTVDFDDMSATGANPAETIINYAKYVYPELGWNNILSSK